MHKGLLHSKRYRDFIRDRNDALEQIHQNAQVDFSRILHSSLEEVEKLVVQLAVKGKGTLLNLANLSLQLEHETYVVFEKLVGSLIDRQVRMRRSVYSLSYSAQAEAIGRVSKRPPPPKLTQEQIRRIDTAPTLLTEDLKKRIWFDAMSLRTKIIQAFRLAILQELSVEEVLENVQRKFPKLVVYRRPPKRLKSFKEARGKSAKNPPEKFLNTDFIDEDAWDEMVEDYKDSQLPPSRFDNQVLDDSHGQYAWEAERDLTEDFVQSVRTGEVEAAKDMGIQEFVWVAILDKNTDDCCEQRNGLTTSEIAGKVEMEDFDSECDALYPPAHPNCRCQLDPVASADQVEGPNWASFQEWLDSA